MSKERRSFKNLDLSSLFPAENFQITDEFSLEILPLEFIQFATICRRLKTLFEAVQAKGITKSNLTDPINLLEVANTVLTEFPDLLEETSNISREDLNKLPLDKIVELINIIVAVNIKSKDKLLGNWKSLVGMIPVVPTENQKKL